MDARFEKLVIPATGSGDIPVVQKYNHVVDSRDLGDVPNAKGETVKAAKKLSGERGPRRKPSRLWKKESGEGQAALSHFKGKWTWAVWALGEVCR